MPGGYRDTFEDKGACYAHMRALKVENSHMKCLEPKYWEKEMETGQKIAGCQATSWCSGCQRE